MAEESEIVVSRVMRRHLREQPVLRLRELWTPSDQDSGAGQALARVFGEVERQGLALAGTVYIVMEPADEGGGVIGEAVVPVNRAAETAEPIEATTVGETDALSALYRDDIHLTSGADVVRHIQEHAEADGLILDGEPRWVYHTDPSWNLEPDDQLIEVLWPCHPAAP